MLLAITMVFATGCASIVSKSNYPFTVNTTPVGADVTVTDKKGRNVYRGLTPAQMSLKSGAGFFSKASYLVTLELDGFEKQQAQVNFSLDGWYIGNVLFGGLIGILIVDPATGAMWKLKTEFIDITLHESAIAEHLSQTETDEWYPEIMVYDIKNIPESWKPNIIPISNQTR